MLLVVSLWWLWLILIGVGAIALLAAIVVGAAFAQWPGTGPVLAVALPIVIGMAAGLAGVIGIALIVIRGILHWIAV